MHVPKISVRTIVHLMFAVMLIILLIIRMFILKS